MTLVHSLRAVVGPDAESFRLTGHGLAALTGEDLVESAERYRDALAKHVPAAIRDRFVEAQRAHADESRVWLARHDKSLAARIRGYAALGRKVHWAYPWPVVAILGLCEVQRGMARMRAWGMAGRAARAVRMRAIEDVVDLTEDVLRRTNRGIFSDSVPVVLYALRVGALRASGDSALADALLEGPLPPTMDDECRLLASTLERLLAMPASSERFSALAALTLRHFGREQAVFSHHLGAPDGKKLPRWLAEVTAVRTVGAPRIERSGGRVRLVFRRYALPAGFDMRDHEARVAAFGAAYVQSVTGNEHDYGIARDWVIARHAGPA